MADGGETATVRVVTRIAEIPAAEWDACAGADNPFVSHCFLNALEESGSATAETGWLPQHLALEDPAGRLIGAVPMYLKSHSYGEYVFDHSWAAAYERAGGSYYPKLQCAVPFTPVTGRRLLLRPDADAKAADTLIAAMIELASRHKVSSLHVTFPTEAEWERFAAAGFLQRTGQQFHWENNGYKSFDDFLEALNSRKRKAIRRERRDALAGDMTIHTLTGSDIETRHWDAFFRFYMSTSDRKWGSAYLNREFFDLIGRRMPDKIALVMCEQTEAPRRRCPQPHRQRHALRPQLGLPRRLPVPAFRGVLLSRHRLRDRPGAASRRGRRARHAQDPARLSAEHDLQRALGARSRVQPGHRRFSPARASCRRA